MQANPYQAYEQNSVMTASPGELTLMLYNGCLKFIRLAKLAMGQNNIQEKNKHIINAENIIREFMTTLDMNVPISEDYMRMYDYIYRRLIEANTQNSLEILEECEDHVTELRDTWKEVLRINKDQKIAQGGAR